jgi:hypothetical protein
LIIHIGKETAVTSASILNASANFLFILRLPSICYRKKCMEFEEKYWLAEGFSIHPLILVPRL